MMFLRCLTISALLFAAAALPAKNRHKVVTAAPTGKWFDRIFVINLENTDYNDAAATPFFKTLSAEGVSLSKYYALTHPSQPNYIAQIYGSNGGISGDSSRDVSGKSLVDLMEAKGISWKSYQEQYPGNCFTSSSSSDGLYVRKHNPFISMTAVQKTDLCKNIVSGKQLDADIKANQVPQLVYYTPNMNNDGHDTSVSYAADWLSKFLVSVRSSPSLTSGTLFFVTFDESEDYGNDNQVYTVMFGDPVKGRAGTTDTTRYNHYSLLRTIEDNWELGNLGRNDASAKPITL